MAPSERQRADLKFRKRDVKDVAMLEALVVEHTDALEARVEIVEAHPLFGDATIDLAALDADGALTLIALGLIADGAMILRALGAYAWCVEHRDALRQRYPAARLDAVWPPRVLFVAEGIPESFIRKVKRLAIPAVDCIEVQYLEVDGAAGLYSDLVARIRRGADTSDARPAAPARTPGKPEPVRVAAPIAGAEATPSAGAAPAPAAPAAPPAKPQAKSPARPRPIPRPPVAWPPPPVLAADEETPDKDPRP